MAPRVSTLPIQPKIPEISVGTSNRTDHLGLIRPEYLGAALKVVHFDRSGYLGRSVGRTEMSLSIRQNCCLQYRFFV